MNHEVGPWNIVRPDGPTCMIQFCTKSNYKAFGPLTRCKPNVDQEEWPCTKTMNVLIFLNISKRAIMKIIIQVWPFACPLLSSSSLPKIKLKLYIYNNNNNTSFIITTFLCHGPLPFYVRARLLPLHHKTHWTMSMDNVGLRICLWGTSNSMVTLTNFSLV